MARRNHVLRPIQINYRPRALEGRQTLYLIVVLQWNELSSLQKLANFVLKPLDCLLMKNSEQSRTELIPCVWREQTKTAAASSFQPNKDCPPLYLSLLLAANPKNIIGKIQSVVYNLINKQKNIRIFNSVKRIFIFRLIYHQTQPRWCISIFYLLYPQSHQRTMSTVKPSTPRGRYSKLQNKILNTSHTHRNSQYQVDPIKKESRTKARKETTENSNVTSERLYGEHLRAPFTEIFEHSTKNNIKFNTTHKKETSTLAATNQELQQKISTQAKEISLLRETLASIKQSLGSQEGVGESQQLRKANSQLQKKFQEQSNELSLLKKEINSVKEALEAEKSQTVSMKNSSIVESKVSRRAEYAKVYEINTAQAAKGHCSQCVKHSEEMEELRSKYGDELRKMSQEITALKQKEILLGVLELQIQNKNDCIDFLRSQLETFEDNSRHLLAVVDTLQTRLAEIQQESYRPPTFYVPSQSYRKGRY